MPAPDFLFAVQLTDEVAYDQMLGEVVRNILGHVGYRSDSVGELLEFVRGALVNGRTAGRCELRLEARDGELLIVVSYGRGREWHTSRPLP